MFVIDGVDVSAICKIDEIIGYMLSVEVYWGELLAEFMTVGNFESRRVHYGMILTSIKVADEGLYSLGRWCGGISRVY